MTELTPAEAIESYLITSTRIGRCNFHADSLVQHLEASGFAIVDATPLPDSTALTDHLRAYAAKYGEIDPERAMCLEAAETLERAARLPDRKEIARKIAYKVMQERSGSVRMSLPEWQVFVMSLLADKKHNE